MRELGEVDLHPKVRTAIELAGWRPGRRQDISSWVESLGYEGYDLFEEAVSTLTQLGGLRVASLPSSASEFGTGDIFFDPVWASQGERARIAEREQDIRCKLCPVGEWLDNYILLSGDDGRYFAETSFQVLYLGSSLSAALETMVLAERPPEIISD
ncbi:SUKH-3 domain-containing protein [Nonomuraea sp. B1E8]|uniref:SUKH-3 domain-containing protein n=1 Tax=unclassified Nonomuraea TaxID=2593643 RepID=UPI00325EFACB